RRRRTLCRRLGSEELGRRLGGRRRFGLLEHGLRRSVAERGLDVLAVRVLRLALLPDREQRRRDEDRRVGAREDADEEREGEVLQRRAAEEEQRADGEQRDEGRRQRAADRLPQRRVRDRR